MGSIERLPQEILHDPEFKRVFVAVREDRKETGAIVGSVVASGPDPEEVLTSLRNDRKVNPNNRYYFARPIRLDEDVRNHWVFAGKSE
jgi:hypothetical protein